MIKDKTAMIVFFQTFGVEPSYYDECHKADEYWSNEKESLEKYGIFDNFMRKKCKYYPQCYSDCEHAYTSSLFPKITAYKMLQLIYILLKNQPINYLEQDGYFRCKTLQDLFGATLNELICMANLKDEAVIKAVKEIFSEVDEYGI